MPKATEVISHAEATALFFRRLVDEGVPVSSAIQLACSYVGALVLGEVQAKPPVPPWEPEK